MYNLDKRGFDFLMTYLFKCFNCPTFLMDDIFSLLVLVLKFQVTPIAFIFLHSCPSNLHPNLLEQVYDVTKFLDDHPGAYEILLSTTVKYSLICMCKREFFFFL
ncbi:hypothetical protein NE237_000261 [Protea cynaroides]|uniref:Cytochrome b5 n=1 Tax=Protea cynaroides TaxID=273540 RepID=A0A9Q0KR60_9MAGN|nr:hypothetical protein NE237_000261 [Protea cynaroides]